MNVSGTGSNRADLGIVFPDLVVLVEIKSAKDKLTRLEAQFEAFSRCCHTVIIAAHEKHFDSSGQLVDCPWMRWSHREHLWRYPGVESWEFQRYKAFAEPHAHAFLEMLWAEELKAELDRHRIGFRSDAARWELIRDLTLKLTGKQIREAVCRRLRSRQFAEADPAIEIADQPAGDRRQAVLQ